MSSEDYNNSPNLSSDDEVPESKRTRYNNNESHIYGIFADDNRDEVTEPISRREVNFVPSNIEFTDMNNGEFQENERPSFGTFAGNNGNELIEEKLNEISSFEENEHVSEQSPIENEQDAAEFTKPTHKLSKNFGKFGASSSGFGLKFLKKFGYKEGQGLGSKGQGLAEPILPNVRKDYKAGIAHSGSEMDEYTRKLEKQRFNKPDDSSDEDNQDNFTSGNLNRRFKSNKPKVQFKSFKQTLEEINQKNLSQQKVIDMTGSQPKEMNEIKINTSDIYSKEDKRLLKELGIFEKNHYEDELIELNDQLKALEIQHQTIGGEFKLAIIELELIEIIETSTQKCQQFQISLSSEDMESLSIYNDHLQNLNNILNREIPSNFFKTVQHQLSETAVACIIPNFKRIIAQWNPLQNPLKDVSIFFSNYPNLFYTSDTSYLSATNQSAQRVTWDSGSGATPMTPFDSLIYHVWLPKVRSTLVNQWNPQDYDSAIRLFEIWGPPRLVSSYIFELIINQYIIPKMHLAVENWNPKKSAVSLELFIHPWLPLIHSYLNPLIDTIRSKLGLALANWHPQDPAAFNIVTTWQSVFSEKDMSKLIDRSILPKLFEMIKLEFIIDPSNQNNAAITNVIHWHTYLGDQNIEKILKDAFFPKFYDTLKEWLSIKRNLDLEEVFEWIHYWRTVFPHTILSLGGVDYSFRFALDLLNESIDKISH